MRMTVLGGGGAFPTPERGCSGYLLEHDRFHLLLDPGYATLSPLLARMRAEAVDAVLITHGHGDHCADLNPLLRARHLSAAPPAPLPVFALAGAAHAVLAMDARMLAHDYVLTEFAAGDRFGVGPFEMATRELAHSVPNAGVRISAGGAALAYTGDGGADAEVPILAADADVLLAEASFADGVPDGAVGHLADAGQAGRHAAAAGVGRLVLAHLLPETDPDLAAAAARRSFDGPMSIALPGLVIDF